MIELKGGGYRNTELSYEIDPINFMWKFRNEFQCKDVRFENCCVWLSAVLLIDKYEPEVATHMLEMMNIQLKSFEWMFLCKVPIIYQQQEPTKLIDMLQKKGIGYTLKKVRLKNYVEGSFLELLLNPKIVGKFICQLESHGGNRQHVIGVDCEQNAILDSCETHALKLTRENLDYCCGQYLKGLKHIVYCYELIKN